MPRKTPMIPGMSSVRNHGRNFPQGTLREIPGKYVEEMLEATMVGILVEIRKTLWEKTLAHLWEISREELLKIYHEQLLQETLGEITKKTPVRDSGTDPARKSESSLETNSENLKIRKTTYGKIPAKKPGEFLRSQGVLQESRGIQ